MERITPGRKESPNQRPEWYPGVAATWVFEITGAGTRGAVCIIRPPYAGREREDGRDDCRRAIFN